MSLREARVILGEHAPNVLPVKNPSSKNAKPKPKPQNNNHTTNIVNISTGEGSENDTLSEISNDEIASRVPHKSCNQIRSLINRLIESGEMKVSEFQKAIGVSSGSYYAFMHQNGPMKGFDSATYRGAYIFFAKRQLRGVKQPSKKAKKTAEKETGAGCSTASKKGKTSIEVDFSHIQLDGEETDDVPIYDTCDAVRRKISNYLRKDGVTQASFLRQLHAMLNSAARPLKIQGSSLTAFRGKKGPTGGCQGIVYYAAYVFFEKLRVVEKKPKSKERLEMEDIYGWKGAPRDRDPALQHYIVGRNSSIYQDKYGQMQIARH